LITYSVASNRGENTDWFRVSAFPSSEDHAASLSSRLTKGAMVYVDADFSIGTYADKETGDPRTSVNIVQRTMNVLKKGQSGEDGIEAAIDLPGEEQQTIRA